MKRKLSALLVICLCAAMLLPGLFSTVKAEETGSWRSELTTVAPGKLTVATSPDFAPYEFYSIGEDGTPALAGFDMELAQYIADYLGLELDIVTVDFDGVLSELQTQSVDLGMAGLSPNEERKKIMDFSDIYYQGGQSLVTIQDRADEIATLEDVNKADYTVGAQIGSIQMDLANEFAADANIVAMPKVTDLISELIAGKEDAAFIEKDVALCYQKNYPQLAIVCDVPYDTEGSAIGVCKGNAALLAAVNEAVAAAVADSSMNQFVANANELATGEKYEGLLEEGKVPGSAGAESAEGTESIEVAEETEISESEAAEETEISESAATAAETENAETAAAVNYEDLVTVAAGKLTVATSPDFAPYEFYSIGEDGTPALAGFDMELAQYIADYLGLELDIVTVDFDGVLSELQTQSVDLGMAGLSPNEERKKIMDFSDIYYQGGQSLVTIQDRADEITTLEDVNKADYTVGAQIGSIQMDLANEFAADANIVAMPKVTDLISELIAGKEDAAFIEKDVALCYQKNYPQLAIVCDVPYDTEGSAIGVCKGNATLLAAVNDAVAAAVADSSMNQFVANANELATGEKYEGLLEEGKVPGSSGAESAGDIEETEIAEAATEIEAAEAVETETAEAAVETEIAEAAKSYEGLTTVAPGKLTVATSPDFAPYEFYSIGEDGTPVLSGFDMELAQYIADYLGLELEIVTVDFDGVLSELQTQSVDLGMAGLSPNEERQKIMDFSDIYYQGGQSLVTVQDRADEITTLEDVNKADYTVGAQIGSIQMDLASEFAADANIVAMPKVTDLISELIAGKEDAAFIEKDVALCYQKNYPQLAIVCDVPYDTEGSAIGVNKGNAVLLEAVNDAVAAAVADSSMNQFVTNANELATGETYEGLLEAGKVPGSAGAESAEATEAEAEPAESAESTEVVAATEAVAAESSETSELAAAVEEETAANDNRLIKGENFAIVAKYQQLFVRGILVTVLLSIFTVLIGFVLALMLALMRLSNFRPLRFLGLNEEGFEVDGGILAAISKFNPLSFLATAYVEIIRSTPVIVQIFIIYYGVFSLIKLPTFAFWGIRFDRFFPGVVALGLNSGAYLCEIIRSGIQSVDGGQTEAARSLGMSKAKTMRYIILPQAMSNILPAIANEFVVIIKESSITYTIGVQDIMSAVNAVKGAAFVITEPLLVATALYFCLCFPTSKLIAYFERRMSRGNKR